MRHSQMEPTRDVVVVGIHDDMPVIGMHAVTRTNESTATNWVSVDTEVETPEVETTVVP